METLVISLMKENISKALANPPNSIINLSIDIPAGMSAAECIRSEIDRLRRVALEAIKDDEHFKILSDTLSEIFDKLGLDQASIPGETEEGFLEFANDFLGVLKSCLSEYTGIGK